VKAFLKILTVLLLLFNGIGAIYGGGNLILHPDGSSIELSPDWLKHTPFRDYLIPGIILFIANGLLSVFVLVTLCFSSIKIITGL
jgi:amino acid permease